MNGTYGTIADGLITTLIGMGTVFIILVFLTFIIKMMAVIFKSKDKEIVSEVVSEEPIFIEEEVVSLEDDLELVAVITAAIMAGLDGDQRLVVRSIRRVNEGGSPWNRAGIQELMNK